MVWFFERDAEALNLETRYDNDTAEFVAIVRYPDGHEQMERFTSSAKFGSWLEMFERTLEAQSWTRASGGPTLLPEGWPNKRVG